MILELNIENQLCDIFFLEEEDNSPLSLPLGTIVSGILYEESRLETSLLSNIEKVFIVDDIHMYKGQMLSKKTFHLKSGFLLDFLHHTSDSSSPYEYHKCDRICSSCWLYRCRKSKREMDHLDYGRRKLVLKNDSLSS
jgi:hypothetical protein